MGFGVATKFVEKGDEVGDDGWVVSEPWCLGDSCIEREGERREVGGSRRGREEVGESG